MPLFPRRPSAAPSPSSEGARGGMPPVPVEAGQGISASWGADGLSLRSTEPRPIWVLITGQASGTNRYAWTQVDDGDTEGEFPADLSEDFAATGTSAEDGIPAYELNGRTDVAADSSVRVQAWPAGDMSYLVFVSPESEASSGAGSWRQPVRAATTAPVSPSATYANGPPSTLTGTGNGPLDPIDGVAPVLNNRFLLKSQANPVQNGFFKLTQAGSVSEPYRLTREDFSEVKLRGAAIVVEEGSFNKDSVWTLATNSPITVGTTPLHYELIGPRGFPAELTSVWSPTTGYDWTKLVQDEVTYAVASPTVAGQYARTPEGDETLSIGDRGWLEPAHESGETGWTFIPEGSGSGISDGPGIIAAGGLAWILVATVDHTDLTDADTSQDIAVFTQDIEKAVHSIVVVTTIAGAGGGVATVATEFIREGSQVGGVGDGMVVNNRNGAWTPTTNTSLFPLAIEGYSVDFSLRVVTSGANVADLTAGEWKVYVLYSTLPP